MIIEHIYLLMLDFPKATFHNFFQENQFFFSIFQLALIMCGQIQKILENT